MRTQYSTILFALAALLTSACDDPDSSVNEDPNSDVDRAPLGKADNIGSCAASSCDGPSLEGTCWCDDLCESYGDCCSDKALVCDAPALDTWADALPVGLVELSANMSGTESYQLGGNAPSQSPLVNFRTCAVSGENPGDLVITCAPGGVLGILPAPVQSDGTFAKSSGNSNPSTPWAWSYDGYLTPEGGVVINEFVLIRRTRNVFGALVTQRSQSVGPATGTF